MRVGNVFSRGERVLDDDNFLFWPKPADKTPEGRQVTDLE
jgi:hypothetical protein